MIIFVFKLFSMKKKMKKMKWMLPLLAVFGVASACAPKPVAPKVLVLYYSQSNTTQKVAEEIAGRLGADLEAVVPVKPYDGTYQETIERCLQERESGVLPEVKPIQADLAAYDVIFLGYPIWFGTCALPFLSVLDQIDLSGKKVVPFCTFGSGGLVSSVKDLAEKQPEAEILPGYGVRSARIDAAPQEIDRFLKAGGFIEGEFFQPEPFPATHPVSEAEAALFDEAVGNYPMIHARATDVTSRTLPEGTEYLFTAVDQPRDDNPQPEPPIPFHIFVLAAEGQAPVFTQVVR